MIDWEEQWRLFAPNFYDGCAHIPLPNGKEIRLQPGEGFGDLSHPTTQLMLQLMSSLLHGETVIDIGCGSGILSIAAAQLGAQKVYGIDIDPGAIAHSQKNSLFNQCQNRIVFDQTLPEIGKNSKVLVLMNMILPEQKAAWKHYGHLRPALIIASGILAEQKKIYLETTRSWGWGRPTLIRKKSGWLALVFKPDWSVVNGHPGYRAPIGQFGDTL